MKKLMLSTIISLAASSIMLSQVHLDVKLGVSPGSNGAANALFVNRDNPFTEFQLSMIHTDPQFYGGIMAHIALQAPFFVESGLSYTKRTSVYNLNFTVEQREPLSKVMSMSEKDDILFLPVDIGVSLGNFEVTSGLRLNKTIKSSNELSHLSGFSNENPSMQLGWQMGVRYGFANVMAGIEFMGSLNRICQGMSVNQTSLEMQNVPGKLALTLQYKL